MKKLVTTDISTTNGMPLKSGSLVHIQSAYTEAIAEVVKALAGATYSNSIPYRLNGLVNTGGTVSAGSLFFNGEVYLVDSFSLPTPANARVDTTYFADVSADPVDFTDGTPRNIHEIRKVVFGTPVDLGFTFAQLQELGRPEFILSPTFPLTITFDRPRIYFRSLVANPAAALTVTLSDAGAVQGVEATIIFQADGTTLALTSSLSGFSSIMGIGGTTNPQNITVNNAEYFVVKYRAYVLPGILAGNNAVSIEILENN